MLFDPLLIVHVLSGWGWIKVFPIPSQNPKTASKIAFYPQGSRQLSRKVYHVQQQILAIIKANKECQPLTEGSVQFVGGLPEDPVSSMA